MFVILVWSPDKDGVYGNEARCQEENCKLGNLKCLEEIFSNSLTKSSTIRLMLVMNFIASNATDKVTVRCVMKCAGGDSFLTLLILLNLSKKFWLLDGSCTGFISEFPI
jgi:hypothetical protein